MARQLPASRPPASGAAHEVALVARDAAQLAAALSSPAEPLVAVGYEVPWVLTFW